MSDLFQRKGWTPLPFIAKGGATRISTGFMAPPCQISVAGAGLIFGSKQYRHCEERDGERHFEQQKGDAVFVPRLARSVVTHCT
jgi:hypothetical protein